MAGVSDLILTSSVDLTGANKDLANFARNAPPVKIRVDSSSLGAFSKNASEFQKSLQASSARVLAFSLTASQVFGVVRAFQAVTKATIEVEKQLTDINVILNLSQKQLQGFSRDLFRVASETGNSFKTAAEGATELSRQGLSAVETLKRLKDALTLTRLSGLSVQDSISAITTAINGFNDAALDSTTIINKLANVDAQFAVSSKDLADALSRVGSTAKDTGVRFDELLGLITAARQITGREGAVIGNSLKTIFQRIERPEVLDNLRELGVLVEDYAGKTLSARQILENLGKTYDTLSQAQKNQVVQLSAGVFQANQFRAILSDLAKQNSITARATDAASNATDQASRRQAELNKTLSANINETLNNLTQLASKVGTLTLEPVLRKFTGNINDFANNIGKGFSDAPFTNLGVTLGEGILKGIGNYLSGPGLILGGALLGKLFLSFASFTSKSLVQVLEVGSGRAAQESAINKLIQDRAGLDTQIIQINASNLSVKEKELRIQQAINAELIKGLATSNQVAGIHSAISSNVTSQRLFSNQKILVRDEENLLLNPRKRAAVGFIPSLQESIGAIKGGYKPGEIKEMHIPNVGKVVYNSAEQVKTFPGLSQPAIIPPQASKAGINYNKSFIKAHGFSPYKAEGLIPNFAKNPLNSLDPGIVSRAYDYRNLANKLAFGKGFGGKLDTNEDLLRFRQIESIFLGKDAVRGLQESFTDPRFPFINPAITVIGKGITTPFRILKARQDYKFRKFKYETEPDKNPFLSDGLIPNYAPPYPLTLEPSQAYWPFVINKLKNDKLSTLQNINPKIFTSLASKLALNMYNPESLKSIQSRIQEGRPLDPGWLKLSKLEGIDIPFVTSHEGRHRAFVSSKLGIENYPTIFEPSQLPGYPKFDTEESFRKFVSKGIYSQDAYNMGGRLNLSPKEIQLYLNSKGHFPIKLSSGGLVPNFIVRDVHRGYVKDSLDQGLYGDRTIGGRSLSEQILENLNKRPSGREFLFDALSGAGSLPGYTYATSLSKDLASKFAGSSGGLSSAKIRILSKEGNKRLLQKFNKQNRDLSYNDYLINLASSKPFGVRREGGLNDSMFAHEQEVRVLDPYKLVKFTSSGLVPNFNNV